MKTLMMMLAASILTISAYVSQANASAGAACTVKNIQELRYAISTTLNIYDVEYAAEVFEYCAENAKDKRVRHLAITGVREAANRRRAIDEIFRQLP